MVTEEVLAEAPARGSIRDGSSRVCIYGAGAIGLDLAGALIDAGHAVSLVARGPNLEALRGRGLELRGRARPTRVIGPDRFACAEDPGELGEQALVFVTTKSDALAEVAPGLGPLLGAQTPVVTAMNGLPPWFGHGRPGLARHLPGPPALLEILAPERILAAVIHRNAARVGPGVVERIAGAGLVLGELDGRASPRLAAAAALLEGREDYPLGRSPDIYRELWHKLLINATINPLSVLCEQTLDVMVRDPSIAEELRALIAEVEELGVALELVGPASFDVDALFERFASERRGAITSMLRDHRRGRPLELEHLVRAPLRLAARPSVAVPMPRLRALLAAVEAKAGASGPRLGESC